MGTAGIIGDDAAIFDDQSGCGPAGLFPVNEHVTLTAQPRDLGGKGPAKLLSTGLQTLKGPAPEKPGL